jgi:hypothetical protein
MGSDQLSIQAEPTTYSPVMSSTVGIGLSPVFTPSGKSRPSQYRWHSSFGQFVSWAAPAYIVRELGQDTISGDEKIYWTYDPKAMAAKKPPVEITASAEDSMGRNLARTMLRIGWDGATARVTINSIPQ